MKLFKDYLIELRSHPELNPRIGVKESLSKYKDDPNIYITFTSQEKVGIKPDFGFDTPLGIYTYPLKLSWKYYNLDKKSVYNAFPFAYNRPFVYVLKADSITDMEKYSEQDWNRDLDKLKRLYKLEEIFILMHKSFEEPIMWLWNLTKDIPKRLKLPGNPVFNWNFILRKLGYSGFLDSKARGYIHPNERLQAVFLDITGFKVVNKIENRETGKGKYEIIWNNRTEEYTGFWDGQQSDKLWIYGIFNKGTWYADIWRDGIWKNGTFVNGTWKTGIWKNGIWKFGTWKNGTWENGTWIKGFWQNGIWKDGIWEDGYWDKGIWENGTWKIGNIFSMKYERYIKSRVSPKEFYKLEKESSTIEELKKKVN
jgi:hypothetical protein